ncbi:hypothetical protein [Promicromonospora sp. NPDC019610]|uniref:hypothetical protein n=1 Tax=Promicromonospora sp. NPDC019610 TaxID=3364405 RepID=UPI0037A99FA2
MSYDIFAFDPGCVTDEGFSEWWDAQSEWTEDHSYSDVGVTTADLQAFYRDLAQVFPPMNGPGAPTEEAIRDDPELKSRTSSYAIGTSLVYVAFAWSQVKEARRVFAALAEKYGVAVAWVSDDSSIVRP